MRVNDEWMCRCRFRYRGSNAVYVHAQVYDIADAEGIKSLHSNREAPERVWWRIECDDGLEIIS